MLTIENQKDVITQTVLYLMKVLRNDKPTSFSDEGFYTIDFNRDSSSQYISDIKIKLYDKANSMTQEHDIVFFNTLDEILTLSFEEQTDLFKNMLIDFFDINMFNKDLLTSVNKYLFKLKKQCA